ncbi:MAG: glycosyltransferase family 4 protein [Bacteroidales bacterium]|nr:glycosyltransferase family 4 protein [Bacteroidales bacterium]
MNIGIIIGRIGGADGVALETEKWIDVLRSMGHSIYILSGQFQERQMDMKTETLVCEMSFFSPESFWSQKKAFFYPETDPQELIEHLNLYSKVIYKKILNWIGEKKIDLIISENASALPSHLEMGLAVNKAVHKCGLPTITHDHDFAWERGDRYVSPHKDINEFVSAVFPLRAPNSIHAVINTHAKNTLLERFQRESVNVPNVMDFSKSFGVQNQKNEKLAEHIGFKNDDLFLYQVTRIVRRKGIETAIKLLHELNDKKIKLIITGNYADDSGSAYYNELVNQIHELRLGEQVGFAYHLFHNKGLSNSNGEERFSLSDAYARATACTYFSIYEGFGNAFVEAVLAKRPVFVNNYEPVYMPDIGTRGFKTVMIENSDLTEESVKDMSEVIYNPGLAEEIALYNFELGKKYFSYDTLREKLEEVIRLAKTAAGA